MPGERRSGRARGRDAALPAVQAAFLRLLVVRQPRSLQKVATAIGAPNHAVYRASVALRRRGWVERDEDVWRLTPDGDVAAAALQAGSLAVVAPPAPRAGAAGADPLRAAPRPDGSVPRLSRLQARFLLLLATARPRSLRHAAATLATHIATAHRASALLRERGWAARGGGGWELTAAGEEVLPAVRAWLAAHGGDEEDDAGDEAPGDAPHGAAAPRAAADGDGAPARAGR